MPQAQKKVSLCILGLDPGFGRCGWGMIRAQAGDVFQATHGCIETERDQPLEARLRAIAEQIRLLIRTRRPVAVGIEDLFLTKNARTVIPVAAARGVLLLVAAEARVPVVHVKPNAVKLQVTGYGRASKIQVQAMVGRLLGITEPIRPDDAADALAIALTALAVYKTEQRLTRS